MIKFPDPPSSYWQDSCAERPANDPLVGDVKADVAIIGAGFSGLAAAYELKRAEPALRVAILEAKKAGYGASGRNGSFAMTVVGLGFGVTARLKGEGYLRDAHTYMMRAVDALEDLVDRENLVCDKSRPGFLRAATTPGYAKRIQHDVELINRLGFDDIYWLDAEAVNERVHSPYYLGAMWEPRLLLLNPLKLVQAEVTLVQELGATLYEECPVLEIEGRSPFILKTPKGRCTAGKIVFATNAYSHLFSDLSRKQVPAFTYMIATEPLSAKQLQSIGWQGREGLEDARNLIHYYRLTPDNRLLMGGGPVGLTWANQLNGDFNPSAWRHLVRHAKSLFPALEGIRATHKWGGPFSVTVDLNPAIGYAGDRRAVYSLGCIGHGVSMSHLNGQTIRDLILERKSELVDGPFVNRRVYSWPPEPLRSLVAGGLRTYLQLEDWAYERQLPKGM